MIRRVLNQTPFNAFPAEMRIDRQVRNESLPPAPSIEVVM